jgi:hypothetical protein
MPGSDFLREGLSDSRHNTLTAGRRRSGNSTPVQSVSLGLNPYFFEAVLVWLTTIGRQAHKVLYSRYSQL